MRQKSRGFILIDALICVLITGLVCTMCYSMYNSIVIYEESYLNYQNNSNENLENIYNSLSGCEICIIEEEETDESD